MEAIQDGYRHEPLKTSSPRARAEAEASTPRRHRRRGRKFLLLLLVLGGLVYAAPMLLARSGYRDRVLGMALDSSQGTLATGGASLAWHAPVVLRDVQLRDAAGAPLLDVAEVRSTAPLWRLALYYRQPGDIQVTQPVARLQLRADGSNLEDFLAPWLEPSDATSATPAVTIHITDGRLLVTDETEKRQWELHDLNAQVAMRPGGDLPTAQINAVVAGDEPGKLSVHVTPSDEGPLAIRVETAGLPLALTEPLLRRYVDGCRLDGRLDCNLTGSYASTVAAPLAVTLRGEATARNLFLAAPQLAGERLALTRVHVPLDVASDGKRIDITRLEADCDVGHVAASGSLPLAGGAGAADLLAALTRETYRVEGQLDLARLATLLPNTLRLRADTRIESGRVDVTLVSQPADGRQRWEGSLQTTALAATSGGRRWSWEEPVEAKFAAHLTEAGPVLERLDCRSDFLQLTARGTAGDAEGTARYDLEKLTARLAQFVDLGAWRLAGRGDARFGWTLGEAGRFSARTDLNVQDFALAGDGGPTWTEKALTLAASADGALVGETTSLARAELQLVSAGDRLDVRLRQPVADPLRATALPLDVQLVGQIPGWLARLRPWITPPAGPIAGKCDVRATADVHPQLAHVTIPQATATLEGLSLQLAGIALAEPTARLETTAARWDSAGRLQIESCRLQGRDLDLTGEALEVTLVDGAPPALAGNVNVETTLERIAALSAMPAAERWRATGPITAAANLTHENGHVRGKVALLGTNLTLRDALATMATPPTPVASPGLTPVPRRGAAAVSGQAPIVWQEPRLEVAALVDYDTGADRLKLDETRITSQTLGLELAGAIDQLTAAARRVDLRGTVDYDLQNVVALARPWLGEGVQFVGRDQARFALAGPLPAEGLSPELVGQLELGWQQGVLYGVPIGASRLAMRVAGGELAIEPLAIPVSEGTLRAAPRLQFDPSPATLHLPAGPLLENVRLTPRMCDIGLKYVAPILADATRTEGRFSVELEGARVPLSDPQTADVAGRMAIERFDVMPGPLADQLLLLAKQVEALSRKQVPPTTLDGGPDVLLRLEPQQVDFRMVQGRVYHRGLEVWAGRDVMIRTHGSVGLDQTLALVAEVPVQDAWVERERGLAALRGQSLQVPIAGTLGEPRMDSRAIQQLASQLLRGAAQQAIGDELNRQLNKLLRPK